MSPPDQTQELPNRPDTQAHDAAGSHPDAEPKVTTPQQPKAGLSSAAPGESQPPEQREAPAMAGQVEKDEPLLVMEPKSEATVESSSVEAKGKQPELAALLTTDAAETRNASMSTLKPARSTPPPPESDSLSADPSNYVDPTPATPMASQPPSRTPSTARSHHGDGEVPTVDTEMDEKRYASEDEQEGQSGEIKSIMEQFSAFGGGPGEDEVMSPRLEIASPTFGSTVQHPPRKSSLEPLSPAIASQINEFKGLRVSTSSPASMASKGVEEPGPPVPPKDGGIGSKSKEDLAAEIGTPISPVASKHRPPPPEPEPEPALPFDFHRFLEQLRNKKADPVARYLKSFLAEFGKKQWMVHEQVKIIGDFLAFIANKMATCEVWREVSDAEFDNAREGMEKLVMNRLYTQTFSPTIPAPKPIPGAKPKRRGGDAPLGPGRRGQHQEDVERDDILTQKINIYAWVRAEHLDIQEVGDSGRRFLKLASQELLKIKSYRAPRDKIICVLNCSKVIFGLLKHNKSDSSADSFMPMLIYVVLQSNPEHLVSNVQYILRFRDQEKLGGEAGYYLSSLMGAIQFIENMDRTTLTITDEEFEKNVEAAVSSIAEKHRLESPRLQQEPVFNEKGQYQGPSGSRPSYDGQEGPAGRGSMDDPNSEGAAITGILKTFQKPLTSIGRMFSDDGPQHAGHPSESSTPGPPPRSPGHPPGQSEPTLQRPSSRHSLSAEEAAARQASAEAAEAQRLHRAEHANIVETLAGMFPDLDREIISDVVYQKEGRVGLAVDACLALST